MRIGTRMETLPVIDVQCPLILNGDAVVLMMAEKVEEVDARPYLEKT